MLKFSYQIVHQSILFASKFRSLSGKFLKLMVGAAIYSKKVPAFHAGTTPAIAKGEPSDVCFAVSNVH